MGKDSLIEWTDHTFNLWIGCTKVSPGCAHCYAELESKRRGWAAWGAGKPRQKTSPATWGNPLKWNQEAQESRRRRRVFCASLADVFDAEADSQWREDLWALIRQTSFLDWLILTKRPENIAGMLPSDWGDGWPNVCLMTSVEDQARTARISQLLEVPARYRGLSMEPLLGPVTLQPKWLEKLDWIILGGKSGGQARPLHPDWVRSIQKQCHEAGVRFFFKQWGCWSPEEKFARSDWKNAAFFQPGSDEPALLQDMKVKERRAMMEDRSDKTFMFRADKHATSKVLDGQIYRAHPFGRSVPEREIVMPLAPEECERLQACEKTIREGLGTFVSVGAALMEIHDARLYRQTHSTFEAYVQSALALSRPRAYELIDSAKVMTDLSGIPDILRLPINEAQATELRRWKTPEERVEKWKTVLEAAGDQPLTAKFIRQTLRSTSSPANASGPNDTTRQIKACLSRLRGLVAGSPVAGSRALELIGELEQMVSNKVAVVSE